jgi:hypothetical protein
MRRAVMARPRTHSHRLRRTAAAQAQGQRLRSCRALLMLRSALRTRLRRQGRRPLPPRRAHPRLAHCPRATSGGSRRAAACCLRPRPRRRSRDLRRALRPTRQTHAPRHRRRALLLRTQAHPLQPHWRCNPLPVRVAKRNLLMSRCAASPCGSHTNIRQSPLQQPRAHLWPRCVGLPHVRSACVSPFFQSQAQSASSLLRRCRGGHAAVRPVEPRT